MGSAAKAGRGNSDSVPVLDNPLFARMKGMFAFSDTEWDLIGKLAPECRTYERGDTIVLEGDPLGSICIIKAGWCLCSRSLPDGRRQILRFSIPGDILCFDAIINTHSLREIRALDSVTLLRLKTDDLMDLIREMPRLGMALTWIASQDESTLAERLISIGRRSAYERLAHFFVEHRHRLANVGLADGESYRLPLTKEQLADAMGLTSIHIYRTLRRLSQDGLVRLDGDMLHILNPEGLKAAAQFDDRYLMEYHAKSPNQALASA